MKKFIPALIAVFALSSFALAGDCGTKSANAAEASNIMSESSGGLDIIETAVSAGSFNTLATALTEAGLIETLKGKGPFTVFAPNDAAFGKVPTETLDALLKDKPRLTSVLTYHVISGVVMASDVMKMNGKKVKTVNGKELIIRVDGGKVFVDNAQVIATDVTSSNGVIHVLDTVMMPK